MAKQLGVIQFSGKLGDIVGAKKAAGQQTNTLRVRRRTIKNPKSILQREQRLKLTPAVNFYRALAGILDHSWQGVAYGSPSHNFFMKQAMLQDSLFPYLVKGDTRAVPGYYLISKGGLPSVPDVTFGFNKQAGNAYIDSPVLGLFFEYNTVGEASQGIITNSVAIENGDQLTFVVCIPSSDNLIEDDCSFTYKVFRFVLDTESTTPLSDWAQSQGVGYSDSNGIFVLSAPYPAVAGAIIVSRPPLREGGAWQRSTTYLSISGDIQKVFMMSSARLAALESYATKTANTSSEWYLNQGTSGGSAAQTTATVTITRNPEAGGTVTGAGTYEVGEAVTVVATSAVGYSFDGWYRDGSKVSANTTYQFVLGSSIALEARFSHADEP